MATKKKKTVEVGYMLKLWVTQTALASTLQDALGAINTKRELSDFLELEDGVEIVDYSIEPVSVTNVDRIDVND